LIEGDDVAREHTFVHNVGAGGAGGGRDSTTPAALAGRPAHLEAVFQLERQLDAMRLRAEEERLEAEARAERARRFEEARLAALREEVRAAQAERAALQASQAEEERAGRRHSAEAAARGARAAYSASSFFTQHGYQGQRGAAPSTGFSTGLRHSSSGSANGRELMQGPRGGLYYINSNGNKTYVRQK
jgi:colicin import membrane protein